jgi:hypothetical protein
MKSRRHLFYFDRLFTFLMVMNLLVGCKGQDQNKEQKGGSMDGHLYKNLFGDTYYATGYFLSNDRDSIETGHWFVTDLTNPMVLYGNYVNGLPDADWMLGFKDGTFLSSQWSKYQNTVTKCSFALPFQVEETIVDSNYFRLRTMNDSLGKISIIVGVSDTVVKNLAEFGLNSEIGLRDRGYSFRADRKEITKGGAKYIFTEYFMKDSTHKDVKLFHLYGYTPSKSRFIDFVLFHDGPKDDLVKLLYNLMVTSVYINNERFFNPHLN